MKINIDMNGNIKMNCFLKAGYVFIVFLRFSLFFEPNTAKSFKKTMKTDPAFHCGGNCVFLFVVAMVGHGWPRLAAVWPRLAMVGRGLATVGRGLASVWPRLATVGHALAAV